MALSEIPEEGPEPLHPTPSAPQAKQFQPLYTKLIQQKGGLLQKQSKSSMGNKVYQRQGFEFQSVLKERASQAKQRLTMGHKTPLQRRLLIKNQVYDNYEQR